MALSLPLQVAYLAFAALLFCGVAWLTRASTRRCVAALVGVIAFTAASGTIDDVGAHFDLWSYPAWSDPPHPPLGVYLGQSLEFVGVLALISWRVARAHGRRGLVILCVLVVALGLVRDLSVAALFPSLLRFGPAPASWIADECAWAIVLAFAIGIPRAVAGAAATDAPRTKTK